MQRQWILYLACCLHFMWGVLLIYDNGTELVVPIAILVTTFHGTIPAAVVLIFSSMAALASRPLRSLEGAAARGSSTNAGKPGCVHRLMATERSVRSPWFAR